MNQNADLLANYRKNKAPQTAPKWSFREWIGIAVSCAALLLSATSTYLVSLRTVDELRLTIVGHPRASRPEGSDRFSLSGPSVLVFANSGNRAVAITYLGLSVWQRSGLDALGFCGGSSPLHNEFSMNSEPFILKPNEIVARPITILSIKRQTAVSPQGSRITGTEGSASFSVGESDGHLIVCLDIALVTPNLTRSQKIKLWEMPVTGGKSSWEVPYDAGWARDLSEPILIIKETGDIWGS